MKIQEMSQKFHLPAATLRYYEQLNLIEPVPRVNSIRQYNENHVEQIEFILCMKQAGLKLEEIQDYVRLYLMGASTAEERIQILQQRDQELQEQIAQLKKMSLYIQDKIHSTQKEKSERSSL